MTLVQNRLQPLSGSKLLLLFACFILSVSSCKTFKKVPKKNDTVELDPITGKPVTKNPNNTGMSTYDHPSMNGNPLDTLNWTSPSDVDGPITSDGISYTDIEDTTTPNGNADRPITDDVLADSLTRYHDTYNVAVLMPFLNDKMIASTNKVYGRSKLALNFYGGMKMAFEELEAEGVNLNVTVMDTKASEEEMQNLLQREELSNAHLVLGAVRKGNIGKMAMYARDYRKVYVSPLNPSMNLSADNPFYVQLSPSLKTHCEAITKHIRSKYTPDQVVLICRDKSAEIKRLAYFQEANYVYSGSTDAERFKEYIVSDVSSDFKDIDVMPYIQEGKKTVFVVPSWSNESFINSLLRVIRIAKSGNNEIVVYGMPQWMEFNKISYDYYENLEVHVSSDTYLNPLDAEIQSFRTRYFNTYGEVPKDNAYVGYDMMLYLGRMLKKHGDRFQYHLDDEVNQYLHTKFAVQPVAPTLPTEMNDNKQVQDNNYRIQQFENKHVNILKFEEYYFQLAD